MYLLYFYNNVKKKEKKVTSNLSVITFFVQTFLINFLLKKKPATKKNLSRVFTLQVIFFFTY